MFGEHASFIIPSYLISFLALVGTAIYIVLVHRSRLKELKQLEEKGINRRSGK